MIVAAGQGDFPKEGLHAAGAAAVARFQSAGRFVVRKERGVVVECGQKTAAIAPKRGAQAFFDPLRARPGACRAQPRFDFGEEGFGFLPSFAAGFLVEFFLAAAFSSGGSGLRRNARVRAMVCSTKASASCVKRSWLARSSCKAGTSAAGTRRLALRPASHA